MAQRLSLEIDKKNLLFTNEMKNRLASLDQFSEIALEWLMMEHYQFSARNTEFLSAAVLTCQQLEDQDVAAELQRNFKEEENHAKIYKKALFEIGTDVLNRIEFIPTTVFFENIVSLISSCPSTTLGAMYATETAAIFEHEVFWKISNEVVKRRNKKWEHSRLKAFHDLHLNGVEQGHKDGLGLFIDATNNAAVRSLKLLKKNKVKMGAEQAIEAMIHWWDALLNKATAISNS